MKSLNDWLHAYDLNHRHPVNIAIHNFAVPAIVISILGILWLIPFPWSLHPLVNWASLALCMVFSFALKFSVRIAIGLFAIGSTILLLIWWANEMSSYFAASMITIFFIAWILQFIGHHIEGKRPLFFQDVQFLLVGPLWIVAKLYRKANISW